MKQFLIILLLLTCSAAKDKPHPTVIPGYQGKYLLVLREGLAVASCSASTNGLNAGGSPPRLSVQIDGDRAQYVPRATGWAESIATGCASISPEPLSKSEILEVESASIWHDNFLLFVHTVNPHTIFRGSGAYQHETQEIGEAILGFKLHGSNTPEALASLIAPWVRVYDNVGKFSRQVNKGMTPDEVVTAMGAPDTKVDLGEKTLFKYPNMTVEFLNGKVSDVR